MRSSSPSEDLGNAYGDYPLPIGAGQTVSQPYIVAAMIAALELRPTDRVLEVGTGTGYEAAILGELAAEVWTIERHAELAMKAREILARLGYVNVHVVVGDGSVGLPQHAPFDKILVAAAAPKIPESLVAQLADGGRLVVPVGNRFEQQVQVVRKVGPEICRDLARALPLCAAGWGRRMGAVEAGPLAIGNWHLATSVASHGCLAPVNVPTGADESAGSILSAPESAGRGDNADRRQHKSEVPVARLSVSKVMEVTTSAISRNTSPRSKRSARRLARSHFRLQAARFVLDVLLLIAILVNLFVEVFLHLLGAFGLGVLQRSEHSSSASRLLRRMFFAW